MKRLIFIEQVAQWFGYLGKVFDESPVESGMAKKASNTFDIHWWRELYDYINLCFVNFNASRSNFVTEYNTFGHHEMAFFPIKHEVGFSTPLQDGVQVIQAHIIG